MQVKAESQNIRNHNTKSKNTITAIELQNFRFALTIASLSLRPLDEGARSSVFAKAKEE